MAVKASARRIKGPRGAKVGPHTVSMIARWASEAMLREMRTEVRSKGKVNYLIIGSRREERAHRCSKIKASSSESHLTRWGRAKGARARILGKEEKKDFSSSNSSSRKGIKAKKEMAKAAARREESSSKARKAAYIKVASHPMTMRGRKSGERGRKHRNRGEAAEICVSESPHVDAKKIGCTLGGKRMHMQLSRLPSTK